MDSILTSIKKLIGIDAEDDAFDTDMITFINAVFMILHDMGVGPSEGFSIQDSENSWSEYMEPGVDLEAVKTYISQKTKLVFDPPANGTLMEALKSSIKELECRLRDRFDSKTEIIPNASGVSF